MCIPFVLAFVAAMLLLAGAVLTGPSAVVSAEQSALRFL